MAHTKKSLKLKQRKMTPKLNTPIQRPKTKLVFQCQTLPLHTIGHEAKIYCDTMGQYETTYYLNPFEKSLWINYQGDIHMGIDGANFNVIHILKMWMQWECFKTNKHAHNTGK